ASYALSYNDQRLTGTASLAWNRVDNLAFLEEDTNGVQMLSQLDEPGQVVTADLVLGYQLSSHWLVGIGLERFQYDDVFKSSYKVAPVEERIRLSADYEGHGWTWNTTLTWIGSRDLADYGYAGFNTADGNPASLKGSKAPSFYTVDMRLAKALDKTFTAYLGVNNLFDYTQAADEESPLFFHDHTDPSSYDVVYIHGPLRGRTVYAGMKATF
ncbi:MAG TPA: TonB-dependent receptor, partial [Chromatiales bacterium]|nr:TonB-dependent receptor [Chromatiales bacterium]